MTDDELRAIVEDVALGRKPERALREAEIDYAIALRAKKLPDLHADGLVRGRAEITAQYPHADPDLIEIAARKWAEIYAAAARGEIEAGRARLREILLHPLADAFPDEAKALASDESFSAADAIRFLESLNASPDPGRAN